MNTRKRLKLAMQRTQWRRNNPKIKLRWTRAMKRKGLPKPEFWFGYMEDWVFVCSPEFSAVAEC